MKKIIIIIGFLSSTIYGMTTKEIIKKQEKCIEKLTKQIVQYAQICNQLGCASKKINFSGITQIMDLINNNNNNCILAARTIRTPQGFIYEQSNLMKKKIEECVILQEKILLPLLDIALHTSLDKETYQKTFYQPVTQLINNIRVNKT